MALGAMAAAALAWSAPACGACGEAAREYLAYVERLEAAAVSVPTDRPEGAYRFAADVHRELAGEVALRPGVVAPFVVGRSVEDRPIWGFRIRDPGSDTRGKMLIFATIHPMEWVPTEVAASFAESLARNPIPGLETVLIPTLNVDGRATVEADLLEGRRVYRRGNGHGVDLNRDFAVNRESSAVWKAIIPRRYSVSPGPLSQPETRAIDALARVEQFDVAVSLHAFGGFFYSPWAGRWERPPDHAALGRLGLLLQSAMTHHPYKPRQLSRWGFFFRGLGMEVDHLYGRYGALSFLVETTRSGMRGPADLDVPFRWYNPVNPADDAAEGVAYLRALGVEVGAGRAHRVAAPEPNPGAVTP